MNLPAPSRLAATLLIALAAILPLHAQLPTVVTKPPAVSKTTQSTNLPQLAYALHEASLDLPSDARRRVQYATLSILLLSQFNRLLPAEISPRDLDSLATVFLTKTPDTARQNQIASTLPPADSLEFNGTKLGGGNFRKIDSIIGLGGYPIALDRELPARIVPLESAASQGLAHAREEFQSTPPPQGSLPPEQIQDLYNRIHQADIAPQVVEDGLLMRPYAGRIDDLYHQLTQKLPTRPARVPRPPRQPPPAPIQPALWHLRPPKRPHQPRQPQRHPHRRQPPGGPEIQIPTPEGKCPKPLPRPRHSPPPAPRRTPPRHHPGLRPPRLSRCPETRHHRPQPLPPAGRPTTLQGSKPLPRPVARPSFPPHLKKI